MERNSKQRLRFLKADSTPEPDLHRCAAILTLLVFLWGLIAILVSKPLWVPNLVQAIVCGGGVLYFLRTWRRPDRRVDESVCIFLIVYALLMVPWTAVMWCRLGRPMEAFTVPAVAVVSVALVFPGRWWLGALTICLFAAEGLFAFVYAHRLGLDALVPVNEPLATYAFSALGIGILMLRRRRQDIAEQHVRVQAEIEALQHIRPTFDCAREELDSQISVLASEFHIARELTSSGTVARALHRLDELRLELGALVAADRIVSAPPEAERRLKDRDAQLGATALAAIGAALAVPTILLTRARVGGLPNLMVQGFLVNGAILVYLVSTRRRPSSRRAVLAVIALVAAAWQVIISGQFWLFHAGRPFTPFMGHKLLMGGLGLTCSRLTLGILFIVATAVNALVLWFVLGLGPRTDLVTLSEPWVTLVFMLIGLITLRMLEQRKLASVELLRAEVEASAMERRAYMLLAVGDRLNSPLQTLLLGATAVLPHLPASSAARVQNAIDRLVALSRELADLEVVLEQRQSCSASLDSYGELRRRI